MRTENREQRTENREQRTENREQRTENREQKGRGKHYKRLTFLSASLVPILLALTFFAGDCSQPTPNYTVTLNANTGTLGTKTTLTVESGKTATALIGSELPIKANYTLSGWNTKADGTGTAFVFGTTLVTADATIYAQWTQNAPAVPSGLTATVISATQIDLSWTATANATKYNLFDGTTQIGGDITTTSYQHTGLVASSAHSYTLKACNSGGCSAASNAVSATTDFKVTATEISKTIPAKYDVLGFTSKKAYRFHYIALSINASTPLTDYRLALKKSTDAAPSADDMKTKAILKRNLKTTDIHLLLFYDLNSAIATEFTTVSKSITTGSTVDAVLLSPGTTYTLWGMTNDGTSVLNLGNFSTDPFDANTAYNDGKLLQTLDPIIYSYDTTRIVGTLRMAEVLSDYSFSLRANEPRIFPVIVSTYSKDVTVFLNEFRLRKPTVAVNLVNGFDNFGGVFTIASDIQSANLQPSAFQSFDYNGYPYTAKNEMYAFYFKILDTNVLYQSWFLAASVNSDTYWLYQSYHYDN